MDAREASDHGDGRRDGAAHRRAGVLLLVALIALLAVGCGSDDGGEPPADAAEPPPPATELTVTVWPQGRDGPSQETTLTCDPPGGTHPAPGEACTILDEDAAVLEPVPPDSVCTAIYGGPEEAEVVGTLDGEQVRADFNRQSGCEIDRWDRAAALLGLPDS